MSPLLSFTLLFVSFPYLNIFPLVSSFLHPFCPFPCPTCCCHSCRVCSHLLSPSLPRPSYSLTQLYFSLPSLTRLSLSLASGQHQLHGVGRADRHQRAGWPKPGNSSAAEVSPCTLSSRRVALFLFLWKKGLEAAVKWSSWFKALLNYEIYFYQIMLIFI